MQTRSRQLAHSLDSVLCLGGRFALADVNEPPSLIVRSISASGTAASEITISTQKTSM